MTIEVSDEMLMAYVDGELGPEMDEQVSRAVATEPALARRVRGFRESRLAARAVYDEVLSERPPERLVTALTPDAGPEDALTRARSFADRLPLAASLVLVAGIGGYVLAQMTRSSDGDLVASAALADAVAAMRTGDERDMRVAGQAVQVAVLATYEVDGGLCRTFAAIAGPEEAMRGVACGYDDAWRVDLVVAAPRTDGFVPASSGTAEALEAYLDALGAQGPL